MSTIASKSYNPGDVIHTEKPFVRVLRHDLWDKVCSGCCEKSTALKKCSSCGIMKYCGKSCQKTDWPDHKLECPYLRNYTDFTWQEIVQMIGKLILKLKGKDWKTATSRILDLEVSFDDLLSTGVSGIRSSLYDSLIIARLLESYIGRENVPDTETLQKIIGKVLTNSFKFRCGQYPDYNGALGNTFNIPNASYGVVLFLGASKIDHSCVPNAFFHVNGNSITIRAIKAIKKSEKVTVTYTNMIATGDASFKHDFTKLTFGEKCYCSDCSQEFGQSKLTKILDASKAAEVIKETQEILLKYSLLVHTKCPNPRDIFTRSYLKDLLKRQDEVLGRTNLRRMQVLAILHSQEYPDGSVEERRAGCVELTEAMKEVWGDYYPELETYYTSLALLNSSLGNEKEAQAYCLKVWRQQSVTYGKLFSDGRWQPPLSEREFQYFMEKNNAGEECMVFKKHL